MPVACASIQEPSRAIGDYIAMMAESSLPVTLQNWFDARGWRVRGHLLAMLDAARAGASALLDAPTGSGKKLSGFLPSLDELIAEPGFDGLHTLYVSTPKALAVAVQRNLLTPIEAQGLGIRVGART